MPADAAASTASDPNPLVTATMRTDRPTARASMRSCTPATRRATASANADPSPAGGPLTVAFRRPVASLVRTDRRRAAPARDPRGAVTSRPADDDGGLSLLLPPRPVAEPLLRARRAI